MKVYDGFIQEVKQKQAELREIDDRFWKYAYGVKKEKE